MTSDPSLDSRQSLKASAIESYLRKADLPLNMHSTLLNTSLLVQKVLQPITTTYQDHSDQHRPQLTEDGNSTMLKRRRSNQTQAFLKDHEERFLEALQSYQDHAKPKYRTGVDLDLSTKHSWQEVLQAVDEIHTARAERSGVWVVLTKKMRWFGEHSAVFEQWIRLLPTQNNYASVLCGGLKLIFRAAARLKDVRNWICDALLELPDTLSCTEKTLDIYEDLDLHVCSRKLMAKTFESLQWIVLELTRAAAKKGPLALFKQDSYAQDLRNSLDDVKKLSQQFDKLAVTCDRRKLHDVEKVAENTRDQLSLEHLRTNAHITYTGQVISSELKSYLGDVARQFRSDVTADLRTEWTDFLSSQVDSRQQVLIEQAPRPSDALARAEKRRKQAKARSSMLEALGFDQATTEADIADNLGAIWSTTREVQDRVHYLVAEQQLTAWLAEPASAILLINGNCSERESSAAVSFVAAKLLRTIQTSMIDSNQAGCRSIPLHFFCAEHMRSQTDGLAGPAGLLRSIIGELLSLHENFKLHRLNRAVHLADLTDSMTLWSVFEDLVLQLPKSIVLFCILDSITEFEESGWRAETQYIADSLIQLSRRTVLEGRCTFKVLMTSPLTSRSLHQNLEAWETMDMPEQIPAVGGFSDNAWAASSLSGRDYVDEESRDF